MITDSDIWNSNKEGTGATLDFYHYIVHTMISVCQERYVNKLFLLPFLLLTIYQVIKNTDSYNLITDRE